MRGTEKLFKSDKVYGNLDNLKFFDVLNLAREQSAKKFYNDNADSFIPTLSRMLNYERFKGYALVRKCDNLLDTKNSVIQPEEIGIWNKFFYFRLLDDEMNEIRLQNRCHQEYLALT